MNDGLRAFDARAHLQRRARRHHARGMRGHLGQQLAQLRRNAEDRHRFRGQVHREAQRRCVAGLGAEQRPQVLHAAVRQLLSLLRAGLLREATGVHGRAGVGDEQRAHQREHAAQAEADERGDDQTE
ncbi:hypothetical protein D3C85_260920 [compost metagenome]